MPSPLEENLAHARQSLLELLETEHAVIWSEVEAKLTREVRSNELAVYPHVLTAARRALTDERLLEGTKHTTRGGAAIETFSLTNTRGRTTKIRHAAGRKRLLGARYLGWATGSSTYPHGHIGPAGENTIRQAIIESGALSVLAPGAGEVASALGLNLTSTGTLDSGGFLPILDERGVPLGTVFVPIEVKNLRDWVYPQTAELYQLLDKSAQLQRSAPTASILPVLATRRVNHTLRFLALRLGFKVLETRQQYIRTVSDDDLAEVRNELGYMDLMRIEDGETRKELVQFFRRSLAIKALEYAENWRTAVLTHGVDEFFPVLRNPRLRYADREAVMAHFRATMDELGYQGGW